MEQVAPPSSLEAEKALLGSALCSAEACRWMLARLVDGAFYSESHRVIFREIEKLFNDHGAVDAVLLIDSLRKSLNLGKVGGAKYVLDLTHFVSTADYVEHYGRIVLRAHFDRLIIKESAKLSDEEQREQAMAAISQICRARDLLDARGMITIEESVDSVLSHISDGPVKMINTGFATLDEKTKGSEPGDLITLGGRTGHGKTAFLISLGLNLARSGLRVAMFPGEMAPDQVTKRALSSVSGVEHWRVRGGNLDQFTIKKIKDSAPAISRLQIAYADDPSPTLGDIKSFADAYRADVVIVDYLTRCSLPEGESMRVSVNKFMVGLKNFARETNRLVFLAAQINRQTDKGGDVPPYLSDLKESGAIEEESDMVLLLHIAKDDKDKNGTITLNVAVAKNRHGETGVRKLAFNRVTMSVFDEEQNDYRKNETQVDLGY